MAITAIPRQAVSLQANTAELHNNKTLACNCKTEDFCQLVEPSDDTKFQVDLSEISGELVADTTFDTACGVNWICGANWNIAAGAASKTAGAANNLTQTIDGLVPDALHKITFTVTGFTANTDILLGGGGVIHTITGNGTFTIYGFSGSSTQDLVFFSTAGAVITLDDVSMQRMSTVGLKIIDFETGVVEYEESDGTSVTYANAAKALICIDWTQVDSDNCYFIEVFDTGNDILADGIFDTACGGPVWTCGSKWTIPANEAVGDASGPASTTAARRLTQSIALTAGTTYSMVFDITARTSGSVRVVTDDLVLTAFNSTGVKTQTIDLTGESNQTFVGWELENSIGVLNLDDAFLFDFSTVLTSECFLLKDDHECSKVLTATSTISAFGLDYENFSWTQQLRHCMLLRKYRLASPVRSTIRRSNFSYKQLRAESVKFQTLELDAAPEYISEFLWTAFMHPTTVFEGRNYFTLEDDYEPDSHKYTLLYLAELEIVEQSQNFLFQLC